jgi:DNA-binding CsgD family transcriptional regulator
MLPVGRSGLLVPHYAIRLSVAERQAVAALQRAGKTPQQTVRRATILLLAHEGLSNQAIADQVGTSRNLVQKWRKRFALYEPLPLLAEEEVDPIARLGALQDLPRSGRPPAFSPAGAAPGRRGRMPGH